MRSRFARSAAFRRLTGLSLLTVACVVGCDTPQPAPVDAAAMEKHIQDQEAIRNMELGGGS